MKGLLGLVLTALPLVVIALTQAVDRHRRRTARRRITAVPETPIALVKDGEKVRIRGRAVARHPLRTSPISQRACVGFRLTVEFRDEMSDRWQEIIEDEAFDSFVLADTSGEAVLHAPFEIKLDPYRDTFVDAPSAALASLLERRGIPAREVFVTGRRFRYVETVLLPGEEIIAVGRATIEVDPAGRAPSRRDPPVVCQLRGPDGPVVIAAVAAPPAEAERG